MIPLRDNIPNDHFPVVTVVIIAINALVFLLFQGPSFSFSGGGCGGDRSRWSRTGRSPTGSPIPARIASWRAAIEEQTTGQFVDTRRGRVRGNRGVRGGHQRRGHPVEEVDEPPAFLTIFTSMFMHGGWLHIIFNMLFLWIFGNNIEDAMGRVRYVVFYLLGGVAAAGCAGRRVA